MGKNVKKRNDNMELPAKEELFPKKIGQKIIADIYNKILLEARTGALGGIYGEWNDSWDAYSEWDNAN